ncbi:coatomer subunit delta [Sarotherodon galilaeus]
MHLLNNTCDVYVAVEALCYQREQQVNMMAQPIRLRIILGEDDARKLILPAGISDSIEELCQEVKTNFGVQQDFRLQYQDPDFGNEFVNLTAISEINDKATLKVVYLDMTCQPVRSPTHSFSSSSADTDNTRPVSSSGSSPSTRLSVWPSVFTVPRFSYEAELQLEKANAEFIAGGTHLTPSPKLKSHLLERLAEEIIKFKVYPTDNDLNEVAEVLVKQHPCLREQGSFNGCYGWKISLKYKMANVRTKLRGLGCAEVLVNSLKNKAQDKSQAALNVKKPRRAEVNYCPQYPKGETTDSLEKERIALTFSYRRQEVIQGQPFIADFKSRWPALFTEKEIDKEFLRISTVPLLSRFFYELDLYTPRMMELFRGKGGVAGRKMRHIMVAISKDDTIHTRRACILKSLCVYLNEDHEKLVKEYTNTEANTEAMEQTVMGVYVIHQEGAEPGDDPENIGVLIEGVEVLTGLRSIAIACALLFGLIYCLNRSYPPELKCTFEVLQKIIMKLDGQRLSSKAQFLKNKLMG